MNITKEVKELYNEDFRTLRKEMKENPKRLKKKNQNSQGHGMKELTL